VALILASGVFKMGFKSMGAMIANIDGGMRGELPNIMISGMLSCSTSRQYGRSVSA